MALEADLKDLSIDTTIKSQDTSTVTTKDDEDSDRKTEQREASSNSGEPTVPQTASESANEDKRPVPLFESVPNVVAQCDKDEYLVKTIDWKGKSVRIITQNGTVRAH